MKKWTSFLMAACMLLLAVGCAAPAATPAATATPATAAPAHYPVTLTDQAGRSVTLTEKPERVVSGYYISTSLLIALGRQDRLVGIEAGADKRAIYRFSALELAELPSVGSAKEFDLEGCAALEPQLVILPKKLQEAAAALEALGIPVLLVNPETQALSIEMGELLGKALDCEAAAERLVSFTATQETMLADALTGTEKPTVYLAGNSALLSTAGGAMYQSSLIDLAGGQNVAAALPDRYWADISYEQLLAWNPDVIVLAADAVYTVQDVLADENLAGCTALQNGAVYQMPGQAEAWDSPVPGGILGAVWLADELHEEITPQQAAAATEEFYETFYGFSYEEATRNAAA